MSSKKPLIVANWKMNPATLGQALTLAEKTEIIVSRLKAVEVVLAPPYVFIPSVKDVIKKAKMGSQDAFWEESGPYTGQISWRALKNMGVSHVIIGHSERKKYAGETDDAINRKMRALLAGGMKVILCIGEDERVGGEIPRIIEEQLIHALSGVKKDILSGLAIAYEPVWAISTNSGSSPDTPDNAFRTMLYIRKVLSRMYGRKEADNVRVIYGGSVSSRTIKAFLTEGNMQGALVGKASLDPEEFGKIVSIASKA